eukprot:1077969-Prymnesium_polylepis.3
MVWPQLGVLSMRHDMRCGYILSANRSPRCINARSPATSRLFSTFQRLGPPDHGIVEVDEFLKGCLLYTSDAADDM